MKKIYLFWMLGIGKIIFGQSVSTNNNSYNYFKNFPISPSTQNFLRYGEIQNAEYTGTNTTQIPLFLIDEGNIKVPISINYILGNGIKVKNEASTIGLGWDIPFASITQTVWGGFNDLTTTKKRKLDFLSNNTPPVLRTWFEACESSAVPADLLNHPLTSNSFDYFKSVGAMIPIGGYFQNYNNGLTNSDTSPDIFTCNLFGEQLQFAMENFSTTDVVGITKFYCLNKKGFIIEYNSSDLFIITNPSGLKYYFSIKEDVDDTEGSKGSNFLVTKIVDPNSRTINFNYQEIQNPILLPYYAQNLNYTLYYSTQTHSDGIYPPTTENNGECKPQTGYQHTEYNFGSPQDSNYFTLPYASSNSEGGFFAPVPLNQSLQQKNRLLINSISGDFGNIQFVYSGRDDNSDKKLDNIIISNSMLKIVKNVNFTYSYFDSQTSTTIRTAPSYLNILGNNAPVNSNFYSKRLKLNSVKINDDLEYSFVYNATPLPEKDSFATDYWGFFNGGVNNKTPFANPTDFSSASYSIPVNNYNDNKKIADINYAKAGILEKIIYPTKGYSTFDYELNSADNLFNSTVFQTNIINGKGLRLKSQTNYDFDNKIINKTAFTYFSGKTMTPLNLFKIYNILQTSNNGNSVTGPINLFTDYSYQTLSISSNLDSSSSPLSSGDILGYSNVEKAEVDGLNQSKGKIVYEYYNTPDREYLFTNNTNVPLFFPNVKSNAVGNGIVKSTKIYENNNLQPLKEITNNYYSYNSNILYGSSLIIYNTITKTNACVIPASCTINGVYYPQIVDNPISLFGYYPIYSKESLLQNSVTTENLNGKTMETTTDYTYNDLNNLSQEYTTFPDGKLEYKSIQYAKDLPQQNLINANILNVPLRIRKTGGIDVLTKYDGINNLNPTSVVSHSQYVEGQSTPTTEVSYTYYDNKGNLCEYRNKVGVPTTIIWGYNKSYPIAKIEGAYYGSILNKFTNIVAASNDIAVTTESLNTALDVFRNDPSMSTYQITTYTYNPLIGVTSITSPSGIREYYNYDTSNRLQLVTDVNGKVLKEYKYNYKH